MANAPLPAGVDKAQMVGESRWVFIRGYCFMAKVAPDIETPSGACRAIVSVFRPPQNPFGRKTRTITPTGIVWPENLAQSAHRKVCGAKDSHNRPNETVLGRKTCSIARHGSVWAGCPPQDFRDFMAESQPEAFGRCFGKRWPTVGLGFPTRSVIQDLRREMLPFCDPPSPSEKFGSVF